MEPYSSLIGKYKLHCDMVQTQVCYTGFLYQILLDLCVRCNDGINKRIVTGNPHPALPSFARVKFKCGMTGPHLRPASVKNAAAFNRPADPQTHLQSTKHAHRRNMTSIHIRIILHKVCTDLKHI